MKARISPWKTEGTVFSWQHNISSFAACLAMA